MNGSGVKLRKMLAAGQVVAPCVWDCLSVRAAELSGFEAVLLAGGPISALVAGFPDIYSGHSGSSWPMQFGPGSWL